MSFRRYLQQKYGAEYVKLQLYQRSKLKSRKRKRRNNLQSELNLDIKAGIDVMHRCCHSSFWEWTDGSRLIFWRWPAQFRQEARDGTKIFITKALPEYTKRQKWTKDKSDREAMVKKLHKVQKQRYVVPGHVTSLTSYFCVPKAQKSSSCTDT